MGLRDLRDFVSLLEGEGELLRIRREVDPAYEIGCILRRVLDDSGKAVYLERIKGYDMPGVGNLYGSVKNVLRALGKTPTLKLKDAVGELADAIAPGKPIPPKPVTTGPSKEVVIKGKKVNLLKEVPGALWNELDARPTINSGVILAKDPETQRYCLGAHTIQVKDERRLGTLIAGFRRVRVAFEKAEAKGQPLDVAIAIGVDPAIHLVAGCPIPFDQDKLEVACRVKGEAIEVVKGETVDLDVPAQAEMIIEGKMLPHEREPWERYPDFLGFYIEAPSQPVIEVTAITRREKLLFPFIYIGHPHPPLEENYMRHVMQSAMMLANVRSLVPGVRALNITLNSCSSFHVIVSIHKAYQGQPMQAMDAIWALKPSVHTIVVVDEDVDPFDLGQVEWAISTHVSPCRDVFVTPEAGQSLPADTTGSRVKVGTLISRMGIDTTRDENWTHVPVTVHRQKMAEVEARWQEYFQQ